MTHLHASTAATAAGKSLSSRPDHRTQASSGRSGLLLPLVMLFGCALPDAMVVPVLRQIMVERYSVGSGAAHAFMCVNLVGAMLCVRYVGGWRRRFGDGRVLIWAACLNGILLATIAMPIGFAPTLAIRFVEGMADITVYAVLFNIIGRIGSVETRGRRMGAAATAMMLGIATGVGVGGVVGGFDPLLALWIGAGVCMGVSIGACFVRPRGASAGTQSDAHAEHGPASPRLRRALLMMFSDRALASLLATTVPLYLTTTVGLSSGRTGALVGVCMLMIALGAWPAGQLVDRIGWLRMRRVAGCLYAAGILLIPVMITTNTVVMFTGMILIGLAGAALFASSLVVVVESGRGAAGMAAYHTAGNLGFLLGTVAAGALLWLNSAEDAGGGAYITVFAVFALGHVLATATTAASWRPTGKFMAQPAGTPAG